MRDGGLVGHRHRQPTDIEDAHRVERGGRLAVGNLERDEDPVEIAIDERGVEDHRRQRVTNRITDHRTDASGATSASRAATAQSKPARCARWRACSNSDELSVKK